MLSKTLLDRLNEQITLEHFSADMYLQMSAWCEVQGLKGSAFFLSKHAGEEMEHMRKLFSYVNESGHMALVGKIDAPPSDYKSIEDVFARTLEHEKLVTSKINGLVETALADKDYNSFNFLQWYVSEQREEEILFGEILNTVRMMGGEGRGLFFLDREIARRGAAQ